MLGGDLGSDWVAQRVEEIIAYRQLSAPAKLSDILRDEPGSTDLDERRHLQEQAPDGHPFGFSRARG